jgi:uncharacterized SAM-binding protein YcdF (DUF218 family)/glycosyltransferase involved in cell wall biosynthesis
LRDRDILIIGSIDWSLHRQTNQRLATTLAAAGNRVLFIENTGVRAPQWGDLGRLRDRVYRRMRSTKGFTDVDPHITVLSPLLLPFPLSRPALFINRFLLSRSVLRWMRSARFARPVVITFLPTPLAQALIRDVDPDLVVYYCANDMAGPSAFGSALRVWEERLFRDADLVFVISEALRERASAHAKEVYWFPAGVEFDKFDSARVRAVPEDLAALRRPVVGYVGALSGVLDQELLRTMARCLPAVTFALVGPEYTDVGALADCGNVRLLGERPHDQVPAYVKGFDVALIPYVRTSYTDSVYSCKLNEYLAMGVPVVATDMREVRNFVERYGPVVHIGRGTDDFIAKVSAALNDGSPSERDHRIAVAKANNWDERFAQISEVIDRRLQQKSERGRDWQARLIGTYRRNRMRLVTTAGPLLLVYLLVFQTPLVWLAGDCLTIRQPPMRADAIVVFSGNGASTYVNPGYQRRARDAARYYQAGYAPLLVVSSGIRQTFAEVEIIRALLLSQGVPASAIEIVTRYPTTTAENVAIVHEVLKRHGATSILFVTAPYHSRRASMLWRKIAPAVQVTTVPVVDSPPETPQWTATRDQVTAVGYEYLAIAYNWAKGWI